jgi:hypothetical protein
MKMLALVLDVRKITAHGLISATNMLARASTRRRQIIKAGW